MKKIVILFLPSLLMTTILAWSRERQALSRATNTECPSALKGVNTIAEGIKNGAIADGALINNNIRKNLSAKFGYKAKTITAPVSKWANLAAFTPIIERNGESISLEHGEEQDFGPLLETDGKEYPNKRLKCTVTASDSTVQEYPLLIFEDDT